MYIPGQKDLDHRCNLIRKTDSSLYIDVNTRNNGLFHTGDSNVNSDGQHLNHVLRREHIDAHTDRYL